MLDFFENLARLPRLNTHKNKVALKEKTFVVELCRNSELDHKWSQQVRLSRADQKFQLVEAALSF